MKNFISRISDSKVRNLHRQKKNAFYKIWEKGISEKKDTKFTVTEVSAKIGYPNYAYFTKLFKKYSGYTQSAYRNRFGRKN